MLTPQMTDVISNTEPVNYATMPLQMQKDGKFKLDNLSARKATLVRDGKNAILKAPSFYMDRATGKPIPVTTVINVTYDDEGRITQIEERPSLEKRKALGQLMGMKNPIGESAFGTRLIYRGKDCEVDQTYISYLSNPISMAKKFHKTPSCLH